MITIIFFKYLNYQLRNLIINIKKLKNGIKTNQA